MQSAQRAMGIENKTIAVAVDGPAGAGKSTLSRRAAQELGYLYVDTGALYRAIGLFASEQGIEPGDAASIVPRLGEVNLELRYVQGVQRVYLNGRDVSEEIRRPEMSMAASQVSAIPAVREFLLELQREMARRHSVIMDGRDIGTVVLPWAQVKIFLTASLEARARRRHAEYVAKGENIEYTDILEDMRQRDHQDSTRAAAPLRQAEDAVLLDTSDCDFEQSLELLLSTIKDCSQR